MPRTLPNADLHRYHAPSDELRADKGENDETAHRYRARRRRRGRSYDANRAVRIFSLYWPALALGCIALPAVAWNLLAKDWPDIVTSVFLLGSDWRLAFASYPHDHWEALPLAFGPAWSLGAELTFYVMAPFIVRRTFVVIAIMMARSPRRASAVLRRPQQRLPPGPVPSDRDGTVRSTKTWRMLPIDRPRPRRYGPRAKRPAVDGA